tara:strand:- start:158 stop:376 length:219 start_codon:yes stop_codon:yes gene_type:complete
LSTKRTRARLDSGEFRGDDPSTPNVNEAWENTNMTEKKEAAVKKAPAKSKKAVPPIGSAERKAMVLRGEIKE